MTWNLLNYPSSSNVTGDTTERNPYYRAVVQYVNPQILVTQENATSSSATLFYNNVMNANGSNFYSKGTFINGYDTDNAIYYQTSLFHFVSNIPIQTALRDINEFKLVHLLTNDTILIYSCHLKAGAGPPNDTMRLNEVNLLRNRTNALPPGTNFIICGDFNTYSDVEPCYLGLLHDNPNDDGNFVDPINLTGVWNQYQYRYYHTQSTRTRSFGNGSTGGLDDRFDMILFSNGIASSGGITYVPNSTVPIGNDGNHYNDSINQQPNSAVPVYIANALHYASDHLPVRADFTFTSTVNIENNISQKINLQVYPNPSSGKFSISYSLSSAATISINILDITGKLKSSYANKKETAGYYEKQLEDGSTLEPGIYIIQLTVDSFTFNQKLVILN